MNTKSIRVMKTQNSKKIKDFKKFAIKKTALKKVKGGSTHEETVDRIINEELVDG